MLAATASLAPTLMGGKLDLVVEFVRGSLGQYGYSGPEISAVVQQAEVGGIAVVVPDAGGGEDGVICCCQGSEDEEDGSEGRLGDRWHFGERVEEEG